MFLTLPLIFLLNKRNKALWCGLGQLVAALANLLPLLAWLAVPTTYAPTAVARDRVELCPGAGAGAGQEDSCEAGAGQRQQPDHGKLLALGCFFVCKLCSGVAQQAYWTLGLAYMDDSVAARSAPAVLGLCYMAGYLGGFLGKLLGSMCLGVSWAGELGAWWLGWPVLALAHSSLAAMFLLLPPSLGPAQQPGLEMEERPHKAATLATTASPWYSQLWADLKRLAGNKILIFDSLAMSFFLFASSNRSYTSKFVEFQFLTSPAAASLFSGSSSTIGMVSALAVSILVISWFKPSARILAGFNFVADLLAVIIGLSFIFVDCAHPGISQPAACLSGCSCSPSYTPVCDLATSQTYFSGCAAGCGAFNGTAFTDCSCSDSGHAD